MKFVSKNPVKNPSENSIKILKQEELILFHLACMYVHVVCVCVKKG